MLRCSPDDSCLEIEVRFILVRQYTQLCPQVFVKLPYTLFVVYKRLKIKENVWTELRTASVSAKLYMSSQKKCKATQVLFLVFFNAIVRFLLKFIKNNFTAK